MTVRQVAGLRVTRSHAPRAGEPLTLCMGPSGDRLRVTRTGRTLMAWRRTRRPSQRPVCRLPPHREPLSPLGDNGPENRG